MTQLESHPVPDDIDPGEWTLRVTGAIPQPLRLTRADVIALPDEEFTEDFTCVEGWRAEDLSWRGVRVKDVLSRASPTARATHVLVHAMDGEYASAFPIDRARAALLATELDGQPLPVEHGGPARLVPTAAESDCWESVKWVSEIEVTEGEPTDRDTARGMALNHASEMSE